MVDPLDPKCCIKSSTFTRAFSKSGNRPEGCLRYFGKHEAAQMSQYFW